MPDLAQWDYNSAADMADMARAALAEWRDAPAGLARERKAATRLVFAVGRLESLGALPAGKPSGA